MKTRNKFRGFTIVELMVVMSVIAIILSVAVPSISSMIDDNRLSTQINSVMADIHLARSEAAKRDERIIICRSASPNLTVPTCSGTERDYSSGYLMFTGEDGNNTYEAATDTLIRRGQPAQEGVNLHTTWTWNNNLEINPNGTLNEGGTAIMAVCDNRGKDNGKQITIPLSGIPRMYSSNITTCDP